MTICKYKITILLDKKNNWLHPYILNCKYFNNSIKYQFTISFDPDSIKNQDIVFILGYTRILSNDFLKQNSLNLVVHESKLPKGKGFSPMQWQILAGINKIPVSLVEAVNKIDSGDIYYEELIELSGIELYEEWRNKQANATLIMMEKFLDEYPNMQIKKQVGEETFYKKREKKDGELDVDKSIKQQFNLLRIGNNEEWPSFFILEGKKFIIKIYEEDI
jgi:methionyl-tRNA formyltransferase